MLVLDLESEIMLLYFLSVFITKAKIISFYPRTQLTKKNVNIDHRANVDLTHMCIKSLFLIKIIRWL